jgi:hypothetical protein
MKPSLALVFWQPLTCSPLLLLCLFQNTTEMCGLYSMKLFKTGFSSLSIMPLRLTQNVTCVNNSFPFVAKEYFVAWTYYVHSPTEGRLNCFQVGKIINKAVPFAFPPPNGESFSFSTFSPTLTIVQYLLV